MAGKLDGKRVVITGAAANIGRATALLFADEGARLAVGDIDQGAEETAAEIRARGGEATYLQTDVTSPEQVQRLLDGAAELLGGIDVIVNNAGIQRAGPVTDLAVEDWDALMQVNPRSCFLGAKFGIPHLRAAGGGVIVNTSSIVGLKGAPGAAGYSASKGAIVALTKALAAELADDGIRVNAICPGITDTPFNQPAIDAMGGRAAWEEFVRTVVPMRRQGAPEEIAAGMLFLASDMSSFMTGQVLVLDGGLY